MLFYLFSGSTANLASCTARGWGDYCGATVTYKIVGAAEHECKFGQDGICIDTGRFACHGGQIKTGYCAGAYNVKCCTSGVGSPKRPTAPTPVPTATRKASTVSAALPNACMYGQTGTCINTNTHACRGANVRTGFCSGADHIRCCPSGQAGVKPATTITPVTRTTKRPLGTPLLPLRGDAACMNGQPGSCIDTHTHTCVGSAVKVGFCVGSWNIRCVNGETTKCGLCGWLRVVQWMWLVLYICVIAVWKDVACVIAVWKDSR